MGLKNLPLDSGRNIVKVFERYGWVVYRAKNHYVLTHPNKPRTLTISIPDHKEISRSLLKAELRKAGLTEQDFLTVYAEL